MLIQVQMVDNTCTLRGFHGIAPTKDHVAGMAGLTSVLRC